jgi:predicted ABC-type ATPase
LSKEKIKRLRVFAGPNGSGKTTIIRDFPKKVPLGVYVNADDIERAIRQNKCLNFSDYKIHVVHRDLDEHFLKGVLAGQNSRHLKSLRFRVSKNSFILESGIINSYLAADIAAFIRNKLIQHGISFSFETVMSHRGKLDLLLYAKQKGYQIYLYFVATDNPEINISRVKNRVKKKGHNVAEDKIRARYYRSLDLLFDAVKLSRRAYLFDNSSRYYEFVAEVEHGRYVKMQDSDQIIPQWFIDYVYLKRNK